MNLNEFKEINEFEDYMINESGEIISFRRVKPVFIEGKISYNGYKMVGLRDKNGKRKYIHAHRLVALTFLENPDKLPYVNHKDGNKLSNHVTNLEWVTPSENSIHALENELYNGKRKVVDLFLNDKYINTFRTIKECVRYLQTETGFSFDYIRKCISGLIDKNKSEIMKKYNFKIYEQTEGVTTIESTSIDVSE